MKSILVVIVVIAWLTPLAGAQSNPKPGQPVVPVQKADAQATLVVGTATASNFFRALDRPASEGVLLDVSTATGTYSFTPFHSTVAAHTAQSEPLSVPPEQLSFNELRKLHREEIKTLRESLKGKPQSEMRKAVEAKKAEQRAAVKAQQGVDKGEAAKLKKGHPRPVKY